MANQAGQPIDQELPSNHKSKRNIELQAGAEYSALPQAVQMLKPMIASTSWRRIPLIALGILVCLYALSVLWYVLSLPDLGLHAAFLPMVNRFEGVCLPGEPGGVSELQAGDRIVSVGDRSIETWPQLLQAQVRLKSVEPVAVDNLAVAAAQNLTYIQLEGENYVRLRFQRPSGSDMAVPVLSCWCRVGRLPASELIPSTLWFFLKVGLFAVGALVFWQRPTDPSARQFFLLCIVTFGAYMGGYHWSRIASQPVLLLGFMVCSVLLPPTLLSFYLVFPRPKPFVQRHAFTAFVANYAIPLLFLLGMLICFFRIRTLGRGGASEEEVNVALRWLLRGIYVYLGVAALWYLASIGSLIHSYRATTDATERNQVKCILFASLVALVPIGSSLYLAGWERNAFGAGAATWPMFFASVCFTGAFVVSITRYRLMELDQIVSSGMVYFVISFLAVLVYYVVVCVGVFVVGSRFGSPLSQALSVSTTALVLILLLDLARSRLKKVLDRRFYREKHQLDRTLRRMGQAIEQLVDPTTLARHLLHALAELLNISRAAVYLREGNPPLYRLAEALGPAPPLTELSLGCPLVEALRVRDVVIVHSGRMAERDAVQRQVRLLGGEVAQALIHEGQLLALLVLGPKSLGPYRTDDLNLLAAVAQLAALALESAEQHRTIEQLSYDLQAKIEKISEQQRRILALQSQLMRQSPPTLSEPDQTVIPPGGIIGSSPAVRNLLQFVKKVSASQSAVLIRGESGTGKELLARALHENSPRARKALVKVHCAALSPNLLESELFGHVKGAFTDAHRDKIGRFELADGGTLFLDEIGDVSPEVQTKLLRVLQEKTFERVGASEPVRVDVRIIAATHQDLEQLIRQGRFREDLYYRLNVIPITVPPLRERLEDLPELALHFLQEQARRCGKAVSQIDDDALAALKAYSWPGNIRQLENVIERAVVVADGASITVTDLPGEIVESAEALPWMENGRNSQPDPWCGARGVRAERQEWDRLERERLVQALAGAKGNKAEAARALGLARSTLVSRLKKHGLI
jgi:transcriptional regulator with GAF, ATPase, and Fis domain